jgi:hypothetical protein
MNWIIAILAASLTSFVANANEPTEEVRECITDAQLQDLGFTVGSNEFQSAYQRVQGIVDSKAANLEELKGGTIYSSVAQRMVTVRPVDSLDTDYSEMAGDYVLIYDFKTKQPVEVRWYELGVKNVQYNTRLTPCATNMIPMPHNSLY